MRNTQSWVMKLSLIAVVLGAFVLLIPQSAYAGTFECYWGDDCSLPGQPAWCSGYYLANMGCVCVDARGPMYGYWGDDRCKSPEW